MAFSLGAGLEVRGIDIGAVGAALGLRLEILRRRLEKLPGSAETVAEPTSSELAEWGSQGRPVQKWRPAWMLDLAEPMADAAVGGCVAAINGLGLDGGGVTDAIGSLAGSIERGRSDLARGIRVADRQRLKRYVRPLMERNAFDIGGKFEAGFLREADKILRDGARTNEARAKTIDKIDALAARYGATNWRNGYAATWVQTYAVNGAGNGGAMLAFNHPPTRNLFPGFIHECEQTAAVWPEPDAVRPWHLRLQGFAWRVDWEGGMRVLSPLGWNCRCRTRAVGINEWRAMVAESGNDRFPRGLKQLRLVSVATASGRRKSYLPGLDPGFRPAIIWSNLSPFR